MKIVQLLHGDGWGGMEKFCIDLSNRLAQDHEVMLIADPVFKEACSNRVRFVPLDIGRSRYSPVLLYRLYRDIKRFGADIVQVHKQKSIYMMKVLSPLLGVPFIVTKHDMQRKKAFDGLRYAVTISDEVSKTVRAEKLFKIYNGVPLEKANRIEMPKGFNIVAVGGLREVKGFDRLIEAVSQLPFEYHLSILGEGSERSRLEALIEDLGVGKHVSLVGFCRNVPDYLHSADLQVISSYSEGFSLAMVEGIFYAPILLSTKVSGSTEILPDALLYDIEALRDKIVDVYQNKDYYERIFAQTKEQYHDVLTMDHCVRAYENAYAEVVEDYRVR